MFELLSGFSSFQSFAEQMNSNPYLLIAFAIIFTLLGIFFHGVIAWFNHRRESIQNFRNIAIELIKIWVEMQRVAWQIIGRWHRIRTYKTNLKKTKKKDEKTAFKEEIDNLKSEIVDLVNKIQDLYYESLGLNAQLYLYSNDVILFQDINALFYEVNVFYWEKHRYYACWQQLGKWERKGEKLLMELRQEISAQSILRPRPIRRFINLIGLLYFNSKHLWRIIKVHRRLGLLWKLRGRKPEIIAYC